MSTQHKLLAERSARRKAGVSALVVAVVMPLSLGHVVNLAPASAVASCPSGAGAFTLADGKEGCEETFVSSGTWTVPDGVTQVDVVVVGGGGGGGSAERIITSPQSNAAGGGGGGGQVVVKTGLAVSGSVTVTIGAGGAGGTTPAAGSPSEAGSSGSASSFGSVSASGGSGGSAGSGSSGGGGGDSAGGLAGSLTSQSGGAGSNSGGAGGGGGAGAGASGSAASGDAGGQGGDGYVPTQGLFADTNDIPVPYLAGGGGGGRSGNSFDNGALGGLGGSNGSPGRAGKGGGPGGTNSPGYDVSNLGGGGGGAGPGKNFFDVQVQGDLKGAAGGGGRVIIRWLIPVADPLVVTTSALPNGTVGTAYSQALSASGGSGSYPNWQVTSGTLPAGLDLNQSTGTIYGTPTAAGTSTFSVQVTDSDGATSPVVSLSLTVGSSGGGGGGGGGSSTPSEEPSSSASPTPTAAGSASASPSVAPSAPSRLEPAGLGSNPNLPAGGLPAGGSVFLVNGQPVPLQVAPNSQSDPVALVFTAPGMSMRLEGRGDANDPLGLTSKQALILQSEPGTGSTSAGSVQARSARLAKAKVRPVAQTSGDGFAANSPVKLFILPSTYLGQVTTDAKGAFAGAVPIPAGIKPGVYTLQANGFAPDFSVRSLNLGVLVQPTATRTATARAQVYFDVLSPALTDAAKAQLRKVAAKAKAGATRSVVVGYVQGTTSSANDRALSSARADAVAAYLRSLGVKGVYVVRGDGKAKEAGAEARRVNVAVTYRP